MPFVNKVGPRGQCPSQHDICQQKRADCFAKFLAVCVSLFEPTKTKTTIIVTDRYQLVNLHSPPIRLRPCHLTMNVRRPPTGRFAALSGGGHRGGGRSSSNKNEGRLIAFGGISIFILGMYLYARALHAVTSNTTIDANNNNNSKQQQLMNRGGVGGVGMTSNQRMKILKQHLDEEADSKQQHGAGWSGKDNMQHDIIVDEEESKEDDDDQRDESADEEQEEEESEDELQQHESPDDISEVKFVGNNFAIPPRNDGASSGHDDNINMNYKTPWHGRAPPTPPWWLESDPDDSFERIYLPLEDKLKYKNLRNLGKGGAVNKGNGIKHFFNPMCRHYRFNDEDFPTVSVIMTTQNEPDDWISLSVESILGRTPPSLLKEVIVVDDNGVPGHHGLPDNIRKNVDEEEWEYIKNLSPKVKVIKHDDREGCARSRLSGAKVATGEVLMFVDSHIEMLSSTWYHHLAIPIIENPHTIAMQTIDVIDDLGTKDYGSGVGPLQYGIVNTEFWFGYQSDRFGDYSEPLHPSDFTQEELVERKKMRYQAERPHTREPYET